MTETSRSITHIATPTGGSRQWGPIVIRLRPHLPWADGLRQISSPRAFLKWPWKVIIARSWANELNSIWHGLQRSTIFVTHDFACDVLIYAPCKHKRVHARTAYIHTIHTPRYILQLLHKHNHHMYHTYIYETRIHLYETAIHLSILFSHTISSIYHIHHYMNVKWKSIYITEHTTNRFHQWWFSGDKACNMQINTSVNELAWMTESRGHVAVTVSKV